MADFKRKYKEIKFGFGSVTEGRLIRVDEQQQTRKKDRAQTLDKMRNITESSTNTPIDKGSKMVSAKESRQTRLQKWKAERDMRKKMEKMKEKPPFKVGVVCHKECPPISNGIVSSAPKAAPKKQNNPKRITKATEKRLMAKAMTEKGRTESLKTGKEREIVKNLKTGKERKIVKNAEKLPVPGDHSATADSSKLLMFGRIPVQRVFDEINEPAISPEKDITLERRSDHMEIEREHNNSKESASSFNVSKTNGDNNKADSSIETVSLRLSFTKEDRVNSSKNEIEVKNNSVLNESVSKPPSSSNNASGIFDTQDKSPNEPAFFSPYVVSSRGKSSARKEQQIRRGFSLGHSPTDDVPTKDTVMSSLNISVEDEERTAQYFHFLLNRERKRLDELCKKWEEIKLESNLTEDAHYLINQAVGQTCLLINKKFERFRTLVSDCETGKGEMLVTCSDLQGFWDITYMEVKNCDSRFDHLENLRSRNWIEEPQLTKPIIKKKITVKKKVVPTKTSSIRSFLLNKKKVVQKAKTVEIMDRPSIINEPNISEKFEKNANSPKAKYKIKRSKSIGSGDWKSTLAKRESTRMSLLQKVQLSETSKKVRSPLTVMKISKLYKTPDVQLDDTISYVNSDQTPGKSILKPLKDITESESCTKSTHKVNFNDRVELNEVPVDEETRTKIDLANALARIDSFSFDIPEEIVSTNVERRLNFDDDSFDETEDIHDTDKELFDIQNSNNATVFKIHSTPLLQESPADSKTQLRRRSSKRQDVLPKNDVKIPIINVLHATPHRETSSAPELHVRKESLRKEVSSEEEKDFEGMNTSIRVLRNRIVSSNDTPKTNGRSSKRVSAIVNEPTQKENKTPVRIRKKSLTKASSNKKKGSAKRNVKFEAKESLENSGGASEVFPMTPHVRHSKVRSNENKQEHDVFQEISKKTPERVRRSEHKKL